MSSEWPKSPPYSFEPVDPSFSFGCQYAARHFGVDANEFSQLCDQYNVFTIAIQDPIAFNTDVAEVIQTASDWPDFQQKLQVRSQARLNELKSGFEEVSLNIIGRPSLLTKTDYTTWGFAGKFFRNRSIASLTEFFASFGPKDGETNRELPASGPLPTEASQPVHPTIPNAEDGSHQEPQILVPDIPMSDVPVTRKSRAGNSKSGNSKAGNSKSGNSKAGNSRASNSKCGNSKASNSKAGNSKVVNSKASNDNRRLTRSVTSKSQIVPDNKHIRKSDRVMKATTKENPRRSSRLKQKAEALKKFGVV